MRFFDCPIPPIADTRRGRILHTLITVFLCLCIFIDMAFIFTMSSESKTDSGDRSGEIADVVVDVVYPDFDQLPAAKQESILQKVHKFIRKFAHFSEFAILGWLTALLVAHLASRFSAITPVFQWFSPAAFCFAYAASDEIHQIFTQRGHSVRDVLLDCVGVVCGILVARLMVWVVCLIACRVGNRSSKGESIA